jgi:glucose-1-phosphate cytidylyltransferase
MVPVGYRPILWHLMKYYAHYGHTEFIMALGYKADVIKNFFLNYDEAESNDFVLSHGGRSIELMSSDINDWTITFVDTGVNANLGERLLAVKEYLGDDEGFMANYADGLTDVDLGAYVHEFERGDAVAKFLAVSPPTSYHMVDVDADSRVRAIEPMSESSIRINGGFFIFRQSVFDYINEGEELVVEPFNRLLKLGKLEAAECDTFWAPMDTFKDKQRLDDLFTSGETPWMVWKPDNR